MKPEEKLREFLLKNPGKIAFVARKHPNPVCRVMALEILDQKKYLNLLREIVEKDKVLAVQLVAWELIRKSESEPKVIKDYEPFG